jgi:hypothetical protein
MPTSRRLDKNKKEVVLQQALNLDARGFPVRLADIADMANSLLAERKMGYFGLKWPSTFVRRHLELKVQYNRRYDYKRALCKDPAVIRAWFQLLDNTKAKYGIQDKDMYNLDETGFMRGQISTGAVVTASERQRRPKTV